MMNAPSVCRMVAIKKGPGQLPLALHL